MPPRRKAAAVVKQEEESSDDSVPQPPTSRGGRASRTAASTSSATGNKQAASTSSRARPARSTRGKKNVVESEEEEVEGDKQDREEEAQHVQPVAKKAATGGRRAETRRSTNSTTSTSGSSKATTGSKTRTSRQSAKVKKIPDEEETADDRFDVEEEDVKPTIPAKKRAAAAPAQGRGKKVAPSIDSDEASEAEQEQVESVEEEEAEAEEVGSENEVEADEATLSAAAQAQALDEPVVEEAVKDADEDGEEATQRPPPSQASRSSATPAPTAYDLAAQARAAALNHAALEKQREKEREGKPRLVIHQLVLEDFKSYRGRGVIGPFHKSFSSIVGPNGSGKSNTIDALLFVFGYRATKMRQGKLSELIHNSGVVVPEESSTNPLAPTQDEADGVEYEDDESDDDGSFGKKKGGKKGKGKKKDANYGTAQEGLIGSCTVEVWFREIIDLPGRDDFTVVPNSQLIVARTAYRNNSSRYTINGKVSSFTEGEVESIAQMKPKGATEHDEGLLEYLEDIIGTSKYKLEIEAANVEVERLNDARGTQLNRVKLVEREKGALESRKKECDSYLCDQNELVHNNSALFQVNIHQASYNAEIHAAELQEAQSGLDAELEDQTGTKEEVEALQHEYNEMVKDCKDTEKATAEIVKHLAVLDRADVQRQEKKKSMVTKVKKLKKVLEEEGHSRSEAETWVKNHSDTITRVGGEMEKMESLLEKEELELEKVRDSLKGKTEVFSAQIETLQTELQPWAEQIGAKQAAINLAQNERDMLVEKGDTVRIAIEEAEASIHKLRSDDETKSGRLAELTAEKAEVEAQIAKAQSDINAMQSRDAKLRERATAARQRSDEAKASQSASRSQGDTLATLTKLKDQGRLPGFHVSISVENADQTKKLTHLSNQGRLGNLGRIDDKFDVAVSTACGGLDNIITDTVVVAQQCIDVVRKNQLGRVNVMALEKIKARQMDKIATPENVPRLFDLITPKEAHFAPCFFQLLQNTLVANDLEQGKRIAYGKQRWRVVTLDGQLFETTGTMSGGGGRPARGKMSSKIVADEFTPEVVARCEKEREASSEALRIFTEDRSKAERELATLRKRLPEVDMAIDKIKMDVKASDKRIAEATARLKELKTQSKPEAGDLKKIEQLDKEITSLSKDLDNLKSETKGIEGQINALQNKILEVGGVRLRGQQTKVQDLKSQIDLANERLTKAEVGKAKSEKDAAKLTKSIGANQKALEAAQQELEELMQQMQGGDEEVSAVRDAVAKAQAVLESKTDELAEMKRTLDAQIEIMTQFRKREMELKQQVDQHTKLLKEANNAIEYWSEKVANLVLNEINEDDDDDEEGEAGEGAVREKPPRPETELHQYSDEEIAELDVKVLKAKISALEERIARSTLDLSVLKEYARREKEFMQRAADLDAVTKDRDAAKQLADDLRSQRLREFMGGFGIISMKLKEMYQMITLGGNAELELVDSLDPFSEGIIFSVMPPKKSWKNISNLSGGEKTLSSLALVFALHVFKPTPLYFMDEIDAALDFRNVSIVANYIKDRTKNAQFIIISLRNNMFELSSRLIGIYKVANQTRSVAIGKLIYTSDLPPRLDAELRSCTCADNKELAQIQMVPATA
ncbi:BZ3500_MvSof-1268-A1-R1_Chr3-1g06035 [Microbotryum saponariae]|uniref:Structural maintenance of chromosomes protein 4 n=1 Tax=Microbotryum saponariae TaxID=289078 RepID=A0A2X0LFH4_9BASI|nr:BZ3500_MvSof-1268-A1-R1_Chr3-1g06035 [Microbotryum saponariae]SDA03840.1 BZ3501_MvSof-1269-A2-R1_Chr3-2g05720 [Microbotryum saponariae]